MSPDDFPPPRDGLTRYVIEAGTFSDPVREYQEEAWVPGTASALIDAADDQIAIESAPGMVLTAEMTPDDGTHLRIYEAWVDRTVEWLILFPHREG